MRCHHVPPRISPTRTIRRLDPPRTVVFGAVALALLAVAAPSRTAEAAAIDWICSGSNAWSTAGCWNGGAVPGAGDNANLTMPSMSDVAVSFDIGAAGSYGTVRLGNTGGGVETLSVGGGASLAATNLEVGSAGRGTVRHTAQSVTLQENLSLGPSAGSSGRYELSGSAVLTTGGEQRIGAGGAGSFVQSGGSNMSSGNQWVGYISTGSYEQSSGSNAVRDLVVGGFSSATGTYTQTGGMVDARQLFAGYDTGTTGNFTLSTGAALETTERQYVGFSGSGSFTQTGGTNTVGKTLYLARQAGSTGRYDLSGGALDINEWLYVGYADESEGDLVQTGGDVTVGNDLHVGRQSGSTGRYELSSGTLAVLDDQFVGNEGEGHFVQTGGDATVGDTLHLARRTGSNGRYELSAGSLTVTQSQFIGNEGEGHFVQSGGSNSATDIVLGDDDGGSGHYVQTGGTVDVGRLFLSAEGHATSSYTLGEGAMLTASNHQFIGHSGAATFTQTGGSNETANEQWVGYSGDAVYEQSGGSNTTRYLFVGGQSGSDSSYNQTGGTVETRWLYVGTFSGSTGTYTLSDGGALVATGDEHIGFQGDGTFVQTGGSHDVAGTLNMAINGGTGIYDMRGGTLTAQTIHIDNGGRFLHSGGTVAVSGNTVIVGAGVSYTQTGGTLTGPLQNAGTFNANGGSFAGDVTNSGLIAIDGGTIEAGDFVNTGAGAVTAAPGSRIAVSGDAGGNTVKNTGWNTGSAVLAFVAGLDDLHILELQGIDLGTDAAGLSDNFAWGALELASGQSLTLLDDEANWQAMTGALYVGALSLGGFAGGDLASFIAGSFDSAFNVYYDATLAANGFLSGLTYDFGEGGALIALNALTGTVPEPATLALLLMALAGLVLARRRTFT